MINMMIMRYAFTDRCIRMYYLFYYHHSLFQFERFHNNNVTHCNGTHDVDLLSIVGAYTLYFHLFILIDFSLFSWRFFLFCYAFDVMRFCRGCFVAFVSTLSAFLWVFWGNVVRCNMGLGVWVLFKVSFLVMRSRYGMSVF